MAQKISTTTLFVYDENGNKIPVPALKGKSAYEYARDGGYTGTEEEFAAMHARDITKIISLGIASDGLIYLFVEGKPVGTGIPQGTVSDVFGYVDENNTVVLKGDLADGTYTIKYETEDGSVIAIGDLTLGEEIVPYEGYDVYTTFGYTDGKRQSGSNGQIKDGSGYVLSGAVPMANIVGKTVTVRSKGLDNSGGAGIWAVHETNSEASSAAVVNGTISDSTTWKDIQKTYDDSGDVVVSTFVFPESYANYYFRFSSKGSGASATLTIDKEITA